MSDHHVLKPETAAMLSGYIESSGLTLAEVAESVGITVDMLKRLRSGTRAPSRYVATRLADLLAYSDLDRRVLLSQAVHGRGYDSPGARLARYRTKELRRRRAELEVSRDG